MRIVTDFVPVDAPPGGSLPQRSALTPETHRFSFRVMESLPDLFCTGQMLVDTADELGRLEELIDQLREPVEQGHTHARELNVLAEMKQARDPAVSATLDEIIRELDATLAGQGDLAAYPMLTHALAAEAALHKPLRTKAILLLQKLIAYTQKIQSDLPRAHARWSRALAIQSSSGASVPAVFSAAEPSHFAAAGWESAQQHAAGSLPPGLGCAGGPDS